MAVLVRYLANLFSLTVLFGLIAEFFLDDLFRPLISCTVSGESVLGTENNPQLCLINSNWLLINYSKSATAANSFLTIAALGLLAGLLVSVHKVKIWKALSVYFSLAGIVWYLSSTVTLESSQWFAFGALLSLIIGKHAAALQGRLWEMVSLPFFAITILGFLVQWQFQSIPASSVQLEKFGVTIEYSCKPGCKKLDDRFGLSLGQLEYLCQKVCDPFVLHSNVSQKRPTHMSSG